LQGGDDVDEVAQVAAGPVDPPDDQGVAGRRSARQADETATVACRDRWARLWAAPATTPRRVRPAFVPLAREGIALARQRGAYRGRERSLTPAQVVELTRRAAAGEANTALAKAFGISRETVYQYLRGAALSAPGD